MTKNRINWIDFGKGFTIFLVLLGHVFLELYESGKFPSYDKMLITITAQVYIFHIPVFFALSGFFFKPVENLKSFKNYALKRTVILGLPYIFYSIIHFILQKAAGSSVRVPTTLHNLIAIYKTPLGVSWYLYTLWIISMVYGLLSVYIKRKETLFIISGVGFVIELLMNLDIYIVQKTLVWGMFFMLGAVLRSVDLSKLNIKLVIGTTVIFDIIYMICWSIYYRPNVKKMYVTYDTPQFWAIAFIVSVGVAFIIYPRVEKIFPKFFNYFSKYGKDSLGIYILHAPICSMLRIIMLKVGITSVYIHIICGLVLGWFLSIIATNVLKKIPYINIALMPQKYINFR